jgi:phytoene/squalene synthetase
MPGPTHNDAPLLAHAARLTRLGSFHTYMVIRCLVDRDLVADAFRAYAYFRWLDDALDLQLSDRDQRLAMVAGQRELVRRALEGDFARPACDEERLLLDLLRGRRAAHPGLVSYVTNMMRVMEFDAQRRGRLVSAAELDLYTGWLSTAVMDGLTYFIGHHDPYPETADRYKAVAAAHISHMLRDAEEDLAGGYCNIPREVLEAHHLAPADVLAPEYRAWVRGRVTQAEALFEDGKRYIRGLRNVRSRAAGLAYCASFEAVLRRVTRNGYALGRGPTPANSVFPARRPMVAVHNAVGHPAADLARRRTRALCDHRTRLVLR